MTAPVITFTPADPEGAKDGIHLTVTGEVPVLAHIQISDDDDRVRAVSPVFKQGTNPGPVANASKTFHFTGDGLGTFTVEIAGTGPGDNSIDATTAPVYYYQDAPTYTYPDADVLEAAIITALEGEDVDDAEITIIKNGNQTTVEVGGGLQGRNLTITVTGASGITAVTNSSTTGGTETRTASGPFEFGALYLGTGAYEIDLIADAENDDFDIGDSLLDDPVDLTVS